MPTEAAPAPIPAAATIAPMAPPPAPLPRRSIARPAFVARLQRFWQEDSPFLIAGVGLLVGAPVAYNAAAGGDPASASRPGLFGQSTNEGSLNDLAPGRPLTGLDASDPASLIMGPRAVRQAPAGAVGSFPGGAAIRAAAGAAVASAGLAVPRPEATRAAADFNRKMGGTPVELHLEAPSLPGLGGLSASSGASLARAADTVLGRDNGTGMVVRDLKALGGKLAWHGSYLNSAEGAYVSGQRQASALNSSGIAGLFTNGGGTGIGGGGLAAAGSGIGHEGSQGGPSSPGGAAAPDGKSVSSTTPPTPSHTNDQQQPQMPSGGAPGGGGDDQKKQDKNASQMAQNCSQLQAFTHAGPAGTAPADPGETAGASQICQKSMHASKALVELYGKRYLTALKACQAYCNSQGGATQ